MQKLIQGIVDFRKSLTKEHQELFAKLALGQKPDALFIACSDSRVVPNLFASTNPGDLFVLRNMGNLIPDYSCSSEESSASATLEFSLFSLKIADIIVCGHSECGAIRAITEGVDSKCCPHIHAWLKHGEGSLKKVRRGITLDSSLSELNQISQINVLEQIEHIKSYPFVRDLLATSKLRIHGWWFDIAKAEVYCYEPSLSRFVLIDEKEAELILNRLGKN